MRYPRPSDGYCYLDFLEVWFIQAWRARDPERVYKYAREMAHWALLMHPNLAYDPLNVERGIN